MADLTPKAFDGMVLQLSATPLKGNPGEQGKGVKGDTGPSNYQLWLQAGNTGSLNDFLLSIKGEAGEDGKGLSNQGDWAPGFYSPNDYVFSLNAEGNTAMYIALGSEDFLSEQLPKDDATNWVEFSSPKGTPGTDGTNGAKWFIEPTLPDDAVGVNGDCYLNINSGNVYQKENDTWGIPKGSLLVETGQAEVPPMIARPDVTTIVDGTMGNTYSRFTNAAAKTFQFTTTAALAVNTEFHGRNVGAGALTLVAGAGFTLYPPAGGSLIIPQGGTFTVKIIAANEADVIGVTEAP